MSIVNFSIPQSLEKRVLEIIKTKGFASKAEFFRFSAIYFIDIIEKPFKTENERFGDLTDELTKEIIKRYHDKKLPSIKEQKVIRKI